MPKPPEPIPEELLKDRPSTKPPTVKAAYLQNIQSLQVRFHKNDHKLLRAMLERDDLSINRFLNLCVKAYLDADPEMIKVIRYYRRIEGTKDVMDNGTMSRRERMSIFEEIEKGKKEEG